MIFNLFQGATFFGKLCRFLQQGEVDALEQLPHSRAGSPGEFHFSLSGSTHT